MQANDTERGPILVTLGGETYEATLPGYATRHELWFANSRNMVRGRAAALGVCCKGLMPPGVSYEAHSCNAMAYGEAVWDHLRAKGIEPVEFTDAAHGLMAEIIRATFPSEVEDEAVFTSPTEDAKTTS